MKQTMLIYDKFLYCAHKKSYSLKFYYHLMFNTNNNIIMHELG